MDLVTRTGDQDKDGGLDMYDGVAQFLACPHSTCATPRRTINQTVETAAADSSSSSFTLSGNFDVAGLSYSMKFDQVAVGGHVLLVTNQCTAAILVTNQCTAGRLQLRNKI